MSGKNRTWLLAGLAIITLINAWWMSRVTTSSVLWASPERMPPSSGTVVPTSETPQAETPFLPTPTLPEPTPVSRFASLLVDRPAQIDIPGLQLKASIRPVGLTEKGSIGVPADPQQVGWYELNHIRPGERGLALLTGHYDTYGGKAGVFYRLEELKENDEIAITTEEGEQLVFRVTALAFEPYDGFSHDLVYGRSKVAEVRLITCHGQWDKQAHTYDKRLIVSAVFAEERSESDEN